MAQAIRQNAYRPRRVAIVNPHRRHARPRRLSLAQKLAGFGGKRSQAAASRRNAAPKRKKPAYYRTIIGDESWKKDRAWKDSGYSRKNTHRRKPISASRKRTSGGRHNVSAILTAGLPALNPFRPKRSNTMAGTHTKRRRPRANAHRSHTSTRRRRRPTTTAVQHHRRRTHINRSNPPVAHRRRRTYARRHHHHATAHRRRHNPPRIVAGLSKTVMNWGAGAAGALGSRMIPNLVLPMLGQANTGVIGYGANIGAGWVLAMIAGKVFGRDAHNWVLGGTGIGLVLRLVQDFGILGPMATTSASISGMGDVGVLLPSSYVDPPLFTGAGAGRVIPAAWRQLPATPAGGAVAPSARRAGMGASTYKQSTY